MVSDSEREEGELEEGEIAVEKGDSEEEVSSLALANGARLVTKSGCCTLWPVTSSEPSPSPHVWLHSLKSAPGLHGRRCMLRCQGEVNDAPVGAPRAPPPAVGRHWLPAPPPPVQWYPRQPAPYATREPEPQREHSTGRRRSSGGGRVQRANRRRSRSRSRGRGPRQQLAATPTSPPARLAGRDSSLPPGLAETPRGHAAGLPPPPFSNSHGAAGSQPTDPGQQSAGGHHDEHGAGRPRRSVSAKPEAEEDGDAAQAALPKERLALKEAIQELTTGTSMKDAIKWVFTLGLVIRTNCRSPHCSTVTAARPVALIAASRAQGPREAVQTVTGRRAEAVQPPQAREAGL